MKRVLIPLGLLVAAAAGALGWWYWAGRAAEGPGRLTLYGNVDIRQVNLAFNAEGRLEAMLVEEGEAVAAGQVLARLEPGYYEDALALAQARRQAQQAVVDKLLAGTRAEEIAQARAELAEARATAENARKRYERQRELVRSNTASQQAVDDALAALEEARAKVDAAQATLDLALAGPRDEDIRAARAQLAAEQATVELLQRRLDDTILKAPSEGVIRSRVTEPGAVLAPGTAVYTLSLTNRLWVRSYVGETHLGRVEPGMAAEITADSLPGQTFSGHVGFISPVAEFTPKTVETPELRSDLVYRLRIVVERPQPSGAELSGLRQGMPVTVRLDPGGG